MWERIKNLRFYCEAIQLLLKYSRHHCCCGDICTSHNTPKSLNIFRDILIFCLSQYIFEKKRQKARSASAPKYLQIVKICEKFQTTKWKNRKKLCNIYIEQSGSKNNEHIIGHQLSRTKKMNKSINPICKVNVNCMLYVYLILVLRLQ
jgi:hypothetical protein